MMSVDFFNDRCSHFFELSGRERQRGYGDDLAVGRAIAKCDVRHERADVGFEYSVGGKQLVRMA